MPLDAAAEIKSRLDIVDVIGGYVRLERRGRDHKALCPFHSERTPSFGVSQAKQTWYCFGCQEGGDVFTFVQKHEHLDFSQALELLAERAGVELERSGGDRRAGAHRKRRSLELNTHAQAFFQHILWEQEAGRAGRDLLIRRGVPEDLARTFGIGFAPAGGAGGDALVRWLISRRHGTVEEAVAAGLAHPADRGSARDRFRGRLVFPIRDERGQVLGFGGRALGDAVPKYLNTPATEAYDKSRALFGIDLARPAIGSAGSALLVEGYFDVVAAHGAGLQQTVASSGTALTHHQARLLARLTSVVVICFDSDAAGQAAASRAADVLAAEGMEPRIAVLPAGVKDPDELAAQDREALVRCVEEARSAWKVLIDAATDHANLHSDDDRRTAADRVAAVLARIPDAATRAVLLEPAALVLRLPGAALQEAVTRAATGGARAEARRPVVAQLSDPSAGGEPVAPATLEGVPGWEQYVGAVAVQRPELVDQLLDAGLEPSAISSPLVRRLLELGAAADPAQPFPLHQAPRELHGVIARLGHRPLPELTQDTDPESVAETLRSVVRGVRVLALSRHLSELDGRLRLARHEGRVAEAEAINDDILRTARERNAVMTASPAPAALP